MSRYSIATRLGALFALSLLAVVSGCSKKGGSSLVAPMLPASVSVNGYQATSTPGMVKFDVSAVMSNGSLIGSATITEPVLVGLATAPSTRGANPFGLSAAVTGTAGVCRSIASLGPGVTSICLDATGSMKESDPDALRGKAARTYVSLMGPGDVAAVSSFDTHTPASPGLLAIRVYGGGFSSDSTMLKACVDSASFAGGSTSLWDAAYDCAHVDSAQGGSNLLALVLTDGGDNASARTVVQAERYAHQQKMRVYMVGLNGLGALDDSTEARLKWLAQETGGFYARADSASQLSKLFANVFNASSASGCVSATFRVNGVVPPPGTVIVGTMSFKVNGMPVTGPFRVVL